MIFSEKLNRLLIFMAYRMGCFCSFFILDWVNLKVSRFVSIKQVIVCVSLLGFSSEVNFGGEICFLVEKKISVFVQIRVGNNIILLLFIFGRCSVLSFWCVKKEKILFFLVDQFFIGFCIYQFFEFSRVGYFDFNDLVFFVGVFIDQGRVIIICFINLRIEFQYFVRDWYKKFRCGFYGFYGFKDFVFVQGFIYCFYFDVNQFIQFVLCKICNVNISDVVFFYVDLFVFICIFECIRKFYIFLSYFCFLLLG